jgi:3-dehydroquinate synthetase
VTSLRGPVFGRDPLSSPSALSQERFSRIPCTLHPVFLSTRLATTLPQLQRLIGGRRPFLCTEAKLAKTLEPVLRQLSHSLGHPTLVTFVGGERSKNRATKERLEDSLLRAGAGRDAVLVALGGGLVSDIAGFTAGTLMRGVPYINLPTTLLALVDASIGGKTGVNTPAGKNLVGLFHPPLAVLGALDLLNTLPRSEFRSGLAECLKHGAGLDAGLLAWMAERSPEGLRRNREELFHLVTTSSALKCRIVDEDPAERTGRRNILNLGHTLGHAIELLSGYRVSHGSAVAAGLCWEGACAVVQGYLPRKELETLLAAVRPYRFPPLWRSADSAAVFEAAAHDKKNTRGQVAYVPLAAVGRPALPPPHTAPMTLLALRSALELLPEG